MVDLIGEQNQIMSFTEITQLFQLLFLEDFSHLERRGEKGGWWWWRRRSRGRRRRRRRRK